VKFVRNVAGVGLGFGVGCSFALTMDEMIYGSLRQTVIMPF
jgi:hypothetical protein